MNKSFINKDKVFLKFNDFQSHRDTVVLIHGLSGSMSGWEKFLKLFNHEFNIIMIDLRGHGKSFKYTNISDYAIECFSDDINYVLQHLKIDNPIFIAHSFGCLVLVDYLTRHQPKTGKAIFLSAGFNPKNKAHELLASLFLKVLPNPNYNRSSSKKYKHLDYSDYPSNKDIEVRRTWADISNTGLFIFLSCIKHISTLDYRNKLNLVKIPTLFIHGTSDSIFSHKKMSKISKSIKGSKMVTIPDANHVMIFTHEQEISKNILEFIKEDI